MLAYAQFQQRQLLLHGAFMLTGWLQAVCASCRLLVLFSTAVAQLLTTRLCTGWLSGVCWACRLVFFCSCAAAQVNVQQQMPSRRVAVCCWLPRFAACRVLTPSLGVRRLTARICRVGLVFYARGIA
jgi:hypothetical protein